MMRSMERQVGQGFALVIVLWVLAGLTVVVVSIAATVHSSAESIKLLRERLRAERSFLSTSSRIKIIGATAISLPMSVLSEHGQLYLDGRQTRVSDAEVVLLQDGNGLLNINQVLTLAWQSYLANCGASVEEAQRMTAALEDYVDSDSLRRINGAERADYEGPEPGPRNAPLLSREELWRVKGWASFRPRWLAAECDDGVMVGEAGGFNANTAPERVLRARGYDEVRSKALIGARAAGLPELAGGLLELGQDQSSMLRSGGRIGDRLRVRHQMALVEWSFQYDLQFALGEAGGPWRMHEVRVVPPLQTLPTLSSEFPSLDFVASPQDRARLNVAPNTPFGF